MSKIKDVSVERLIDLCWSVCCRWAIWSIVAHFILSFLFGFIVLLLSDYALYPVVEILIIAIYHIIYLAIWCATFYLSFRSVMKRELT